MVHALNLGTLYFQVGVRILSNYPVSYHKVQAELAEELMESWKKKKQANADYRAL